MMFARRVIDFRIRVPEVLDLFSSRSLVLLFDFFKLLLVAALSCFRFHSAMDDYVRSSPAGFLMFLFVSL